jgi:hypothetical protein
MAAQRPDVDADLIAHVMLGALHSEPILNQLADGPARLSAAMRALATAVLDAPATATATATATAAATATATAAAAAPTA